MLAIRLMVPWGRVIRVAWLRALGALAAVLAACGEHTPRRPRGDAASTLRPLPRLRAEAGHSSTADAFDQDLHVPPEFGIGIDAPLDGTLGVQDGGVIAAELLADRGG